MSAPTSQTVIPRPASHGWRRLLGWNAIGVVLLISALATSLWRVTHAARQDAGDVAVVRVAHWQLELGYRNALQRLIDDYNRLQAERFNRGEIVKRIQVVQLPVSEKTYGQLINTHLIAHTAPDIIEMGMASMINAGYKAEFFVNLGPHVSQPNPYNATQFQNSDLDPETAQALPRMAWKDTFIDGMTGGFDRDLQGYYGVATTFLLGGRLAVNLDLLQEATGSDRIPRTMGELLSACDAMRALGKRRGVDIWPIAATRYNVDFWGEYIAPFLAASQRRLDSDHDGNVTMIEVLAAIKQGQWSFRDPAVADLLAATRAMAAQFPNGFSAMDRDSATFLFTQGQAGFVPCGGWDAGTLYRLAQGHFRMAIMGSVLPGAGERWGRKDPVNETTSTAGGGFGVYKLSPHVDAALDFLRYWTSASQNQRFNQDADWVPCIVGTRPGALMQAFVPRIAGISAGSAWLPIRDGDQLSIVFQGQMRGVLTGETDHAQVAAKLEDILADPDYGMDKILARQEEQLVDQQRTAERGIATQALLQLIAPASAAPSANYRSLVSTQAQGLNGQLIQAQQACVRATGAAHE